MDIKTRVNILIKLLKENNLWEEADSILLEELHFNLSILDKCKKEIKTTDDLSKNKYLRIYQQHFLNIMAIMTSLVASPRERSKLKLELKKHAADEIEMMQEKYRDNQMIENQLYIMYRWHFDNCKNKKHE